MKPNTPLGYYTDGTISIMGENAWNQGPLAPLYGGVYDGPIRDVTNILELMPFVARPRSRTVGALPGVHGQIQGQLLNLQTQLGFGAATTDHSGEFNRNIQETPVWPFYSNLLTNLFPQ